MTQIILDNKWMVEIDKWNHHPHRWGEICKRQKGGSPRDSTPTGKFKWKAENVFFPNMQQTIRYIIEQELLDNNDVLTYNEYLSQEMDLIDYFENKIGRVKQ